MRLPLLMLLVSGGCSECSRPLPLQNPEPRDLAIARDLTSDRDLGQATVSELAVPDLAILDFAIADFATPDFAAVPDMSRDAGVARQWQPAVQLVPATYQNYAPSVAINERGETLVGWRANNQNGSGAAAASRFLLASGTWSPAEDLPLTPSLFTQVFVGLDDTGQAAAYQCVTEGELAHYDPATTTWKQQTLPAPDGNVACASWVAMPTSTLLIGIWQASGQIFAGRYDLFGWSQIHALDSSSFAFGVGSVKASANGPAAVVYRGYYPKAELRVDRSDPASQSWTSSLRVDDAARPAGNADVAVDGAGNAMAVWDDSTIGKSGTIWARRYDAATQTWQAAQSLGTGVGPNVALSDDGTAIVMWAALGFPPPADARITWSRFDGGAWAPASALLVGPTGATDVHVAINGSGQAIAAWDVFTSGKPTIWASRLE